MKNKNEVYLVVDLDGNMYGAFDTEVLAAKQKTKVENMMKREGLQVNKDTLWIKKLAVHGGVYSTRKVSHFK